MALAIAGLTLTVLGKNAHFKISAEKIEVSRLLEWSSRAYSITAIKEINHIRNPDPEDNEVFKPYYEIVFDDGYTWNSKMDLREPKGSDEQVFIEVSKYAGKAIREVY